MKSDIQNITDLKLLIDTFYDKVKKDETIGYIFNDVAKVNWETHLPKIYSFWETVLLNGGTYTGNPVRTHVELNEKEKLTAEHFNRWLFLWKETVDELFEGTVAEAAKNQATSMRMIMEYKIHGLKYNKE